MSYAENAGAISPGNADNIADTRGAQTIASPVERVFPWPDLHQLTQGIGRLFAPLLVMPPNLITDFPATWTPRADIYESDSEWRIEAELPGVRAEDIQAEIRGDILTISAKMQAETSSDDARNSDAEARNYYHRERRQGTFERRLTLPSNVTEEDITCEFRDGLLICRLPKREANIASVRRIPIRTRTGTDSDYAAPLRDE